MSKLHKHSHNCGHELTQDKIIDLFKHHAVSKTSAKLKMYLLLSQSHVPLSANEIFQKLGVKTCNISTVFRALNQFKEKNLVREINLSEGFHRYEVRLNDEKKQGHLHHHHIRCRDCGIIQAITGCNLSTFDDVIKKMGFKNITHQLEFLGICKACV